VIWYVDDDGAALFRISANGASSFSPLRPSESTQFVNRVLDDLAGQGIEVETIAVLTREQKTSGTAETVWRGRAVRISQVADMREYFQRLAASLRGD
jgi:hypothetical protein